MSSCTWQQQKNASYSQIQKKKNNGAITNNKNKNNMIIIVIINYKILLYNLKKMHKVRTPKLLWKCMKVDEYCKRGAR